MNILVVEDDRPLGVVLQRVLEKLGYGRVTVVGSAEVGLAEAMIRSYDLFFVDWSLPGLNGLCFIERLRRQARYRTVPVIMVAGRGRMFDVVLAQEAGACAFIRKPYHWRVIRAQVERVLERALPPLVPAAGWTQAAAA